MIFGDTIKKRVLAAIEKRLQEAQVEYDSGVETLEKQLEADKESLALKLVDKVIGKGR